MKHLLTLLAFVAVVLVFSLGLMGADGTLANVNGTTGVSGSSPGSYLTNGSWIRDVIMWRTSSLTTAANATNFIAIGMGGTIATEVNSQSFLPTNGYFSNFIVGMYTAFPSTTNITFNFYTNQLGSAGVNTGLGVILIGTGAAGAFTNDFTHSLALRPGIAGTIGVSSSAAITVGMGGAGGTIEWWRQLP